MKSDFVKLIVFLWMVGSIYFLYDIWANINWIADMVYAYMSTLVQHLRK